MSQISEHFTLAEMTRSSKGEALGLDSTPPEPVVEALTALAVNVLEPIRMLLGTPLSVDSGYRSPAVNSAVGGKPESQHLKGEACDFVPEGLDLGAAYRLIASSDIPFDQLLLEFNQWIHASYCAGRESRRETLIIDANGTRTYAPR